MADPWRQRNLNLLRRQRRVHAPYRLHWQNQRNRLWPGPNRADFEDFLALPSKAFTPNYVLATMVGYAMWQESDEPSFRSNFGYITTNYFQLFYYFPFEHPRFHISTLVRVFITYLDALLRTLIPTIRWPGPRYQILLVRRRLGANHYDEQIASGDHHVLYATRALRSHELRRFTNLPLEDWRARGRAIAQNLYMMAHSQPLDSYENILGALGNENPNRLTFCLKILNPINRFRWEQFQANANREARRMQMPGVNGALYWAYINHLEPFVRDVWAEYERREPVPPDPGFARRRPGQRRRIRLPRAVLAPIRRRRPPGPIARWPHAALRNIMPAPRAVAVPPVARPARPRAAPAAALPRPQQPRPRAGRRELAALLGPVPALPAAPRLTRAQARAAAEAARRRLRQRPALPVPPQPRQRLPRAVLLPPALPPRRRVVRAQAVPPQLAVPLPPAAPPAVPQRRLVRARAVPPRPRAAPRARPGARELRALLGPHGRPPRPGPVRTRARALPREVRAIVRQPVLPTRLRPRTGRGLPIAVLTDPLPRAIFRDLGFVV